MGDLERKEIYHGISEILDNLDELLEDYELEAVDDEIAELLDSIERIRSIVNED